MPQGGCYVAELPMRISSDEPSEGDKDISMFNYSFY